MPCLFLGSNLWVAVFQELVLLNVACLDELLPCCGHYSMQCPSCEELSVVLCSRTQIEHHSGERLPAIALLPERLELPAAGRGPVS